VESAGWPARLVTPADTRQRIIDAAVETVRREGIVGTSARAIARTGGFNQALIFYHCGSVNDVLLAGLDCISDACMTR
jgi:AcrR family transcriptional regulator